MKQLPIHFIKDICRVTTDFRIYPSSVYMVMIEKDYQSNEQQTIDACATGHEWITVFGCMGANFIDVRFCIRCGSIDSVES